MDSSASNKTSKEGDHLWANYQEQQQEWGGIWAEAERSNFTCKSKGDRCSRVKEGSRGRKLKGMVREWSAFYFFSSFGVNYSLTLTKRGKCPTHNPVTTWDILLQTHSPPFILVYLVLWPQRLAFMDCVNQVPLLLAFTWVRLKGHRQEIIEWRERVGGTVPPAFSLPPCRPAVATFLYLNLWLPLSSPSL